MKYSLLVLFLYFFLDAKAQYNDTIVKVEGDTIACNIVKFNSSYISYERKIGANLFFRRAIPDEVIYIVYNGERIDYNKVVVGDSTTQVTDFVKVNDQFVGYRDLYHAGSLLEEAGRMKNIALAVWVGGGLLGTVCIGPLDQPELGAGIGIAGSLAGLVLNVIANNMISDAGFSLRSHATKHKPEPKDPLDQ